MLKVADLGLELSGRELLAGVSFSLMRGQMLQVAGVNGSGKTVLLKCLAGLYAPTSGTMALDGHALEDAGVDIGVLIERPAVYPHLTLLDNLRVFAQHLERDMEPALALLELLELDVQNPKPARLLSLGMRQKLGLATCFMGNPRLLLLDEPFNALDAKSVGNLIAFLNAYTAREQAYLIVASHQAETTGLNLASRIELVEGRVVSATALEPKGVAV